MNQIRFEVIVDPAAQSNAVAGATALELLARTTHENGIAVSRSAMASDEPLLRRWTSHFPGPPFSSSITGIAAARS